MPFFRRDPGPGQEPAQAQAPRPRKGAARAGATLVYHAISLWIPATWGTIAFVVLRRTKRQPLTLRPPSEERRPLWPPEAPWQRLRRYRDEHAEQQSVSVE